MWENSYKSLRYPLASCLPKFCLLFAHDQSIVMPSILRLHGFHTNAGAMTQTSKIIDIFCSLNIYLTIIWSVYNTVF
jgi:hypothetical protein